MEKLKQSREWEEINFEGEEEEVERSKWEFFLGKLSEEGMSEAVKQRRR